MRESKAAILAREETLAPPPRLLVDVPGAAVALSLGQSAIWIFIREGRLCSVRVGRRRLITWASLEALVKELAEANQGNAA